MVDSGGKFGASFDETREMRRTLLPAGENSERLPVQEWSADDPRKPPPSRLKESLSISQETDRDPDCETDDVDDNPPNSEDDPYRQENNSLLSDSEGSENTELQTPLKSPQNVQKSPRGTKTPPKISQKSLDSDNMFDELDADSEFFSPQRQPAEQIPLNYSTPVRSKSRTRTFDTPVATPGARSRVVTPLKFSPLSLSDGGTPMSATFQDDVKARRKFKLFDVPGNENQPQTSSEDEKRQQELADKELWKLQTKTGSNLSELVNNEATQNDPDCSESPEKGKNSDKTGASSSKFNSGVFDIQSSNYEEDSQALSTLPLNIDVPSGKVEGGNKKTPSQNDRNLKKLSQSIVSSQKHERVALIHSGSGADLPTETHKPQPQAAQQPTVKINLPFPSPQFVPESPVEEQKDAPKLPQKQPTQEILTQEIVTEKPHDADVLEMQRKPSQRVEPNRISNSPSQRKQDNVRISPRKPPEVITPLRELIQARQQCGSESDDSDSDNEDASPAHGRVFIPSDLDSDTDEETQSSYRRNVFCEPEMSDDEDEPVRTNVPSPAPLAARYQPPDRSGNVTNDTQTQQSLHCDLHFSMDPDASMTQSVDYSPTPIPKLNLQLHFTPLQVTQSPSSEERTPENSDKKSTGNQLSVSKYSPDPDQKSSSDVQKSPKKDPVVVALKFSPEKKLDAKETTRIFKKTDKPCSALDTPVASLSCAPDFKAPTPKQSSQKNMANKPSPTRLFSTPEGRKTSQGKKKGVSNTSPPSQDSGSQLEFSPPKVEADGSPALSAGQPVWPLKPCKSFGKRSRRNSIRSTSSVKGSTKQNDPFNFGGSQEDQVEFGLNDKKDDENLRREQEERRAKRMQEREEEQKKIEEERKKELLRREQQKKREEEERKKEQEKQKKIQEELKRQRLQAERETREEQKRLDAEKKRIEDEKRKEEEREAEEKRKQKEEKRMKKQREIEQKKQDEIERLKKQQERIQKRREEEEAVQRKKRQILKEQREEELKKKQTEELKKKRQQTKAKTRQEKLSERSKRAKEREDAKAKKPKSTKASRKHQIDKDDETSSKKQKKKKKKPKEKPTKAGPPRKRTAKSARKTMPTNTAKSTNSLVLRSATKAVQNVKSPQTVKMKTSTPTGIKKTGWIAEPYKVTRYKKHYKEIRLSWASDIKVGNYVLLSIPNPNPYTQRKTIGQIIDFWEIRRSGSRIAFVRRYYMPEDTADGRKPHHEENEVFQSDVLEKINVEEILSTCKVLVQSQPSQRDYTVASNIFYCRMKCVGEDLTQFEGLHEKSSNQKSSAPCTSEGQRPFKPPTLTRTPSDKAALSLIKIKSSIASTTATSLNPKLNLMSRLNSACPKVTTPKRRFKPPSKRSPKSTPIPTRSSRHPSPPTSARSSRPPPTSARSSRHPPTSARSSRHPPSPTSARSSRHSPSPKPARSRRCVPSPTSRSPSSRSSASTRSSTSRKSPLRSVPSPSSPPLTRSHSRLKSPPSARSKYYSSSKRVSGSARTPKSIHTSSKRSSPAQNGLSEPPKKRTKQNQNVRKSPHLPARSRRKSPISQPPKKCSKSPRSHEPPILDEDAPSRVVTRSRSRIAESVLQPTNSTPKSKRKLIDLSGQSHEKKTHGKSNKKKSKAHCGKQASIHSSNHAKGTPKLDLAICLSSKTPRRTGRMTNSSSMYGISSRHARLKAQESVIFERPAPRRSPRLILGNANSSAKRKAVARTGAPDERDLSTSKRPLRKSPRIHAKPPPKAINLTDSDSEQEDDSLPDSNDSSTDTQVDAGSLWDEDDVFNEAPKRRKKQSSAKHPVPAPVPTPKRTRSRTSTKKKAAPPPKIDLSESSPSRNIRHNLFRGIRVLLTGLAPTSRTSRKQTQEYEDLVQNIQTFGGSIVGSLEDLPPPNVQTSRKRQTPIVVSPVGSPATAELEQQRADHIVVLAPDPRRTLKFFYSLARGVPVLRKSWIGACIEKSQLVSGANYALSVGTPSISDSNIAFKDHHARTKNSLKSRNGLQPIPTNLRILYDMNILVSGSKSWVDGWKVVIVAAGAEVLKSLRTQRSRRICDCVFAEDMESMTKPTQRQVDLCGIVCVGKNWLIDSLMLQRKLEFDSSVEYQSF